MELTKKLNQIQQRLKVPKNQYNQFGRYNYRSCEDILEAVKPLLGEAVVITDDEIVNIGERYYVKATAKLKEGEEETTATGYARESDEKKGMDQSQITGASSSYARKYALNGLFLIDDNKDADATNQHQNGQSEQKPTSQAKQNLWLKIKNEVGYEPSFEEAKEVISEKTGVNIESKEELTEEKCRGLIDMWQ